jgi:hypothetical protein
MKVEIFTLCDYARGEPTGKLYVIGAFDHLLAPQLPTPLACAIAARLRFDADEVGKKGFALSFIDADGGKAMPDVKVEADVHMPPGESTASGVIVLVLPQLMLVRHGEYAIELTVDGRTVASIPLYVIRTVPSPQPSR